MDKVPFPEPGTLKEKKMLKQLEQLLLDSGFKMEQWRLFPQEPAFALCVFCFYFYLGTSWERASELFPL